MLNFDTKNTAIERLEHTGRRYETLGKQATEEAVELYKLRQRTSAQVIVAVEQYMTRLANRPKEFDKAVSELRVAVERFDHVVHTTKVEAEQVTLQSGVMAGAAVGAGAATMAMGPAAAMAIATTFGTASTGTAISVLSGAAAVNAAMAWLGGGALVAGGGGMAAGAEVLVVLGGPVGWALGGVVLFGTGTWTHYKNGEIAEKATNQAREIEAKSQTLEVALQDIQQLRKQTSEHNLGSLAQLNRLTTTAPSDYLAFNREQKEELGSLKNNIEALSKLINRQIA
jgi:hypothetical protein